MVKGELKTQTRTVSVELVRFKILVQKPIARDSDESVVPLRKRSFVLKARR